MRPTPALAARAWRRHAIAQLLGAAGALAIVGEKRSRLMPDVPGYGELGLETALFDAWYALAAPANPRLE